MFKYFLVLSYDKEIVKSNANVDSIVATCRGKAASIVPLQLLHWREPWVLGHLFIISDSTYHNIGLTAILKPVG